MADAVNNEIPVEAAAEAVETDEFESAAVDVADAAASDISAAAAEPAPGSFEPVPQKYLHNAGLIILITLLSSTAQFSTDLYMPALPTMMVDLNTTQAMTSLSMSTFMVSMAVGMLVISPVADKIGRKPVLLASSLGAAIASLV